MRIQEGLDFIYCGGLDIGFVAAAACGVALRGSVGEAGGEDLLGVGVGGEELFRPLDGDFLGETTLGELVAYPHDVFVVTAGRKQDAVLCQLGCNEGVVVGLDAAQLLVLFALSGVGGGFFGYLFCSEGDSFGFGAEEDIRVMGKTAQAGDVLALVVCLDAKESLIVGVAGEKRRLIKRRVKSGERRILLLFCLSLCFLWEFILVDDTQAVAADSRIAHQRMRVGDNLLFQLLKLFCCTRICTDRAFYSRTRICTNRASLVILTGWSNRFREIRGVRVRIISERIRVRLKDMIEIHEAQSCEPLDILLTLSALKDAGYGEELALGLEGLAAGLAIRSCERLQLFIASDEVGYSFKRTWKRELGGHVFENANVHILSHCYLVDMNCGGEDTKIRMKLVPRRNRLYMPVLIGVYGMFGRGIF